MVILLIIVRLYQGFHVSASGMYTGFVEYSEGSATKVFFVRNGTFLVGYMHVCLHINSPLCYARGTKYFSRSSQV